MLDLIAAIGDPNARSYAYERAGRWLRCSDRPRALSLLNQSLLAARAVTEPAERVLRLADLGRKFVDLGQSDLGVKLLREGQELARKLPTTGWPAFARANMAEALALVDLPASLELLKGMEEERDHERFLGHIAHRLAGTNPVEAERVIRMMCDLWPYSPRCVHPARLLPDGHGRSRAGQEPGPGVHDQLPIQGACPGGDGARPGQDREGSRRGRRDAGRGLRACSSKSPAGRTTSGTA